MKSSEARAKGHLDSEKEADCTISTDLTLSVLTKVNGNVQKAVVFGQRDDCCSAIKPPGLTQDLVLFLFVLTCNNLLSQTQ